MQMLGEKGAYELFQVMYGMFWNPRYKEPILRALHAWILLMYKISCW